MVFVSNILSHRRLKRNCSPMNTLLTLHAVVLSDCLAKCQIESSQRKRSLTWKQTDVSFVNNITASTIKMFISLFSDYPHISQANIRLWKSISRSVLSELDLLRPINSEVHIKIHLQFEVHESCPLNLKKPSSWAFVLKSLVSTRLFWRRILLTWILSDNLRLIEYDTEDPVLATSCDSEGWCAAVFNKDTGYPIYGTRGGDVTVVDSLRSLLKFVSEKVNDKYEDFRKDPELHNHGRSTDTGIEFDVSPTLLVEARDDELISSFECWVLGPVCRVKDNHDSTTVTVDKNNVHEVRRMEWGTTTEGEAQRVE